MSLLLPSLFWFIYTIMIVQKVPYILSHIYAITVTVVPRLHHRLLFISVSSFSTYILFRISVAALVCCHLRQFHCMPHQLSYISTTSVVIITLLICSPCCITLHRTAPFATLFFVVLFFSLSPLTLFMSFLNI